MLGLAGIVVLALGAAPVRAIEAQATEALVDAMREALTHEIALTADRGLSTSSANHVARLARVLAPIHDVETAAAARLAVMKAADRLLPQSPALVVRPAADAAELGRARRLLEASADWRELTASLQRIGRDPAVTAQLHSSLLVIEEHFRGRLQHLVSAQPHEFHVPGVHSPPVARRLLNAARNSLVFELADRHGYALSESSTVFLDRAAQILATARDAASAERAGERLEALLAEHAALGAARTSAAPHAALVNANMRMRRSGAWNGFSGELQRVATRPEIESALADPLDDVLAYFSGRPADDGSAEPPAASGLAVPENLVLGDAETGQKLYVDYCASCHGTRGAGDGPMAASMNPKPAHHNDGAYMNELSNEHLYRVIAGGGGAVGKSPMMTSWGAVLSDEQIQDVMAFVRSLAEDPAYSGS